jgi:hypothetical protein
MMLKLNKHLMPYDPEKLILLDNSDWKNPDLVQPLAHGLFGLAANLIANSYG